MLHHADWHSVCRTSASGSTLTRLPDIDEFAQTKFWCSTILSAARNTAVENKSVLDVSLAIFPVPQRITMLWIA